MLKWAKCWLQTICFFKQDTGLSQHFSHIDFHFNVKDNAVLHVFDIGKAILSKQQKIIVQDENCTYPKICFLTRTFLGNQIGCKKKSSTHNDTHIHKHTTQKETKRKKHDDTSKHDNAHPSKHSKKNSTLYTEHGKGKI